MSDPNELRRLGQEIARLEPTVAAFRRLEETRRELGGARELRDTAEGDDDMRAMAREEIERLEADETRLLEELKVLLLPRDPNDGRDVILEVRAGAGGDEAALFAAELLRMYTRYAQRHRFTPEVLSVNETGVDGIKEAIVQVRGDGAYSRMKFEGGVHRVQRIPATESSGRIHTSTATVVVMPEADEVEITIDEEKDIRIDVKRASGPGGQSVNTTDSAVRITHLPTGLVVEIQDEKSQHKNKAKALSVLRSRLLDLQVQKQRAADSAARKSMVGGGDRSEKVRTYNFPQDRVTDHRIGKTVHNIPSIMAGEIDDLIDALVMADQADGCLRSPGPMPTPEAATTRATPGRGDDGPARRRAGPTRRASTLSCCSPMPSAWTGRRSSPTATRPWVPMPPPRSGRSRAPPRRRAGGLPAGRREFHGIALAVDDRVLIPRPETEQLVDLALAEVDGPAHSVARDPAAAPVRVVDVGTGSGAIAIAVAVALRTRGVPPDDVDLVAVDISPDALDVARENAVGHAVGDRLRIVAADLLPPTEVDAWDVVVANLPYIPTADVPGLGPEVGHEPALALDGGDDGFVLIRRLLDRLPTALAPDGIALLEIGADQGTAAPAVVERPAARLALPRCSRTSPGALGSSAVRRP